MPVDVYTVNADCRKTYNYGLISFNYPGLKRKAYIFRAILEILSGFYFVGAHLRRGGSNYTDVIYYNPTILQVVFLIYLKYRNPKANFKLIIRDIFPDWAIESGIIRNIIVIRVLRYFQKKNLEIADSIFCESKNKLFYMKARFPHMNFQLMYNWVTYPKIQQHVKREANSLNLIYAGNVGIAQNVIAYSEYLKNLSRKNFMITFYSFGDQLNDLKYRLGYNDKIVFRDTVDPQELNSRILNQMVGSYF